MASAVNVALIMMPKSHYIGVTMPAPQTCKSLHEIRAEIDRIDREIVQRLGERGQYVRAAARFKTNPDEVAAKERQLAMLAARREWAEAAGLDPDFIEDLYRRIVTHFVAKEMQHWEAGSGSAVSER
jgi:isochorismate pyruvate lyase